MQAVYGYFSKNLRGRKGQSGFTLIELLVVVTILGVLAAIVTLSLVGITTNAEKQACLQEYKTVQAGSSATRRRSTRTRGTRTAASRRSPPHQAVRRYQLDACPPGYSRANVRGWG